MVRNGSHQSHSETTVGSLRFECSFSLDRYSKERSIVALELEFGLTYIFLALIPVMGNLEWFH